MKRSSFNVLFFLKKTKLLKNGEASVCIRITVNGTQCLSGPTIHEYIISRLFQSEKSMVICMMNGHHKSYLKC